MDGIAKVIDELGLIILSKEIEIELKQSELDKLREKIEMLENYVKAYEDFYNSKQLTK